MRPLIMWARFEQVRVRIRKHTADRVEGELVRGEQLQTFQFDIQQRKLTTRTAAGQQRTVLLDQDGIEIADSQLTMP